MIRETEAMRVWKHSPYIDDRVSFQLELFGTSETDWRGQTVLAYRLEIREKDGETIVRNGSDFCASPMHADDSDHSAAALLAFLAEEAERDGLEYGDELSLWGSDLESRAEAFEYLTKEGPWLQVPCSRYGRNSAEVAPAAIAAASIYCRESSGEYLSEEVLESYMSEVANDSDGPAQLIREYGTEEEQATVADVIGDSRAVLIAEAEKILEPGESLTDCLPSMQGDISADELAAAILVFHGNGGADDQCGETDTAEGHWIRCSRWILRTDSAGFLELEEYDDLAAAEQAMADYSERLEAAEEAAEAEQSAWQDRLESEHFDR